MEKRPYNQINCVLNSIGTFSVLTSFGMFVTFLLLITQNKQFIAFNELSQTGQYPAIFFYVSIILIVLYFALTFVALFGVWATYDIFNKWSNHKLIIINLLNTSLAIAGLIQIASGILTIVYAKTMPVPLRDYMAENLRSNYTGGLEVGYLDRKFDRYVDWLQINYQCCGVNSYEDYRNGYFYNSYNKYTIVSIVPNSCCIYREQSSQLRQCKMKSVNIYRKGCYDILMFWMEQFGAIICSVTICIGVLHIIFSIASTRITNQIKRLHHRKQTEKKLLKYKLNNYMISQNVMQGDFDTSTIDETMSYVDTKT